MGAPIRLVAGLGNPGREYAATRHNAGFWFADALAARLGAAFVAEGRFHGQLAKSDGGLRLLKPSTFMNLSGRAVSAAMRFFDIGPDELLVVHDELDLDPGDAKLKLGGGHAGHNGLRDIVMQLGTPEFWRLRIGIGHRATPRSRSRTSPTTCSGRRSPASGRPSRRRSRGASTPGRSWPPPLRARAHRTAHTERQPMSLKCGIVGLPNVGKSTLFNALTRAGIAADNYPFCTIEPNVGIVEVPDPRLRQLADIVRPERVVPAVVEFVDIAGLVAGASKARGSATSSSRTSARPTRSRTSSGASSTTTSCTWPAP